MGGFGGTAISDAALQGFNQGSALRDQRAQELWTEQHQQKIQDQLNMRQQSLANLRNLTPKIDDGNGNQIDNPDYVKNQASLDAANGAIGDLYHPVKNPGAISKFGHMLTDHLGITNPQDRANAQQQVLDQRAAQAHTLGQQQINSLPFSDIQQAHMKVQTDMSAMNEELQARLKAYDAANPDMTDEERQQAHSMISNATVWGYKPSALALRGNWETQTGTKDGQKVFWRHNKYTNADTTLGGDPLPDDFFQGNFAVDVKQPGAAKPRTGWSRDKTGRIFSVQIDPATNQIKPGSENYNLLPPVGMIPKISTGMYHWVDENNQVHETPETRTNSPSFGNTGQGAPPTTSAPSATGGAPTAGSAPQSTGAPAPAGGSSTPPARRPQVPPAAGAGSGAGSGTGKSGDRILGTHSSGPVNKARSDYAEAVKLSSIADQVAAKPDDAVNQKRLAVALERASAGRFTTQALDYVLKAGWGNTIEQWANNPTTGALPSDIVRQLVEGAHQNMNASKQALNSLLHSPDLSQQPGKKYKHTATNPATHHKIGTDDDPNSPDAKWFDNETGKPI